MTPVQPGQIYDVFIHQRIWQFLRHSFNRGVSVFLRATGFDNRMICRPQRDLLFHFLLRLSDRMLKPQRTEATISVTVYLLGFKGTIIQKVNFFLMTIKLCTVKANVELYRS